MSDPLAARITRHPRSFDVAAAQDARADFADLGPEVAGLIAGTAGCSPYLKGAMAQEAAWLREVLPGAPERALEATLARLDTVAGDAAGDTLGSALRGAKRRVAVLTALCDLGGVWGLEQVTGALTALADRAVHLGLTTLVADEIRRGKLPGAVPDDAAQAGGMVALAMGKMGAHELNYSSDIDLVCLFDETRYPGVEQEARTAFIRVTRRLTALLSDVTAGGYVFRCDLRLRPDAAVTPVCLSMAAAEAYYESVGRTWERGAYIKARPCGGDLAAGERFLTTLTPFVWRKHLDFAAIEDAHDMRLRIRDHRGLHGPITVEGHNMKLGVGGIREIEFFTQTRQLIAGGRDRDLRSRTTVGGLEALSAKGWIPPEVTEELTALYRSHREVEHRLQMVNDAQTHVLPVTAAGVARIAAFCDQDEDEFRTGLLDRLARTDRLTERFFAPNASSVAAGPVLSESATRLVAGWASYPALRSDRAQAIFRRLRPVLLAELGRAANPDEALVALDGFLAGLPAGVQIFSLFEANPQLVELIVDIAATSPGLARYLSRNAGVLDGVIGGSFFADWPGEAALAEELQARLTGIGDYERVLDSARVWMKEWHFRVGVHHLRGLIDAFQAGRQYAALAGAVLTVLWSVVTAEFARKHGPMPGRGAVLVGMGSLGAGRLNAQSDLDLIVIYDAGEAMSEGPRPLATRAYFARLTQGLVTALSVQMAQGQLYEVDMRLRPSGRQGPVATSLQAFRTYQRFEAWTWEHLALTRARVVAGAGAGAGAGTTGLAEDFEGFRCALLAAKGTGAAVRETVRTDVSAMRARLAQAKPATGSWDAKNGPGRLLDIELCAQMVALITGGAARDVEAQIASGAAGILSQSEQTALQDGYRLFWQVQAATRLLSDTAIEPGALGLGGRAFVLRETGETDPASLATRLKDAAGLADTVIRGLLQEV